MNSARLLAHFDRVSEASDAVPRLRRLILDLAVRGMLVQHDPNDQPASEFLKEILAETPARHLDVAPIPPDQLSFKAPPSWSWIRIGHAAQIEMGQSPPSEHYNQTGSGIPFYQGKSDFGTRYPTPRYWCTEPRKIAHKGDILVSVRAPVGPTNVANETCCIGRGLAALRPRNGVDLDFLLLCLKSFESSLVALGFGTTFVAINKKQLISFPLPLPPLAEQQRIVAKVDELMALCDQLEAARTKRESCRERLVIASLQRLNESSDAKAGSDHTAFYLQHLPKMTIRREHVKQLRHSIVSLGFSGRLTASWRHTTGSAETAADCIRSTLIVRRRSWDTKQPAGANRSYPTPVDPISNDLPAIPDSWLWASADAICSQVTDGEHIQPPYQANGIPMLTAKHVRDGFVTFQGCELISESDYEKCVARCKPEPGDILVVSVGATTGRSAIVTESRPFALVRSVLLLKPLINPLFFLRWLQTPWCLAWMRQASEASAQPHLYIGDTKRMPVPIPPVREQEHLVARVDELLAICDQLEAQIAAAETDDGRLLESLLHEALGDSVAQPPSAQVGA